MFRLLDDYATFAQSRGNGGALSHGLRNFQPRFDVKESESGYELAGELPGVDQKDIEVSFTDQNTLQIKGRTEYSRQEGTRPTAQVEAPAEQQQVADSAESETSSYHKPTVEDEATMSGANGDATPAEATPAETPAETSSQESARPAKADKSRYWVSERSVGQFQRTFSFPSRVDQDKVSASLKNGILSVVVPKAAVPENKRINVE